MRWIVTADYWGNCLGMGENEDGVPARGKPEQGDAMPMEFWLAISSVLRDRAPSSKKTLRWPNMRHSPFEMRNDSPLAGLGKDISSLGTTWFAGFLLGSGLVDQSQKMTAAAIAMAEKNVWAQRS